MKKYNYFKYQKGTKASHEEIEKLIGTIALEDDECMNYPDKSPAPLVIKYSDFLAACIDERKVLTREKVLFKFIIAMVII